MAKVSMQLDPNAVAYTDDLIVGKVNTATAQITRASSVAAAARPIGTSEVTDSMVSGVSADKVADGTTNKAYTATEKTKLGTVESNATADQTGAEIQTSILALSDADRLLIKTDPATGEFYVLNLQRDAAGKLDIDYESVAKG